MKTASVSSLRGRRFCQVILLIALPLILSVAAARAMHAPGRGKGPTRLMDASNWDQRILILKEQEEVWIAETDSAQRSHPGAKITPGQLLVVSHAPSPMTAAGIVPRMEILDLPPQKNAAAISFGDTHPGKSTADSGLVSWQLIFSLALLSSLVLIGVQRRDDVSIPHRAEKLLTTARRGFSGALGMGAGLFRHGGSLANLAWARGNMVEKFASDDAEQRKVDARQSCHNERISALNKLNRMLVSRPDSRSVADALLGVLMEDFPMAAVKIRLLDHTTRQLETIACSVAEEVAWITEIDEDGSEFARLVIEDRRPILIRNVQARLQAPHAEWFRNHGWDTYFGIPLLARGQIIGMVAICTHPQREFGGDEVEYLSTLAGQSALAIHNSQLYLQTLEQTAQLRKANAALGKSNRVKSEFLSAMSHEFKTPLNVIMGYAGMMQDGFLGAITEEQRKGLEEVMRCSDDLMGLVMSMLHAASLETDAVDLRREEVGLTELLGDLRSEFRVPEGKPIDLVWDYPANLPIVKTDGEKLKCVLANLIDNAVKFTERGRVIISSKSLPEPGMVEFRIADTGIGIPEKAVAEVFEQFQQLDSSITRTYDGAGLGLYIAKKFSELLGAQISVSTELGKGSTFTLTFPMAA